MSIENEIAGLTQSTTDLLEAVNTKKATLDNAVDTAEAAKTVATSKAAEATTVVADASTQATNASNSATQAAASAASASQIVTGVATGLPNIRPSLNLDFVNSKRVDPRIDFTRSTTATYYDGKTVAKAEENLITNSNSSNGGAQNCTVTLNSGTAPDGTATATLITEDATTNFHRVFRVGGISGTSFSGTVSASLFMKSNGRDFAFFEVYDNTGYAHSFGVAVDLTDGSTTTLTALTTPTSFSVTDAGNGWYRISITCTIDTLHSFNVYTYDNNGSSKSYTGDGTSGVYIWGAQLEKRDTLTAYTPTAGTPITNYIPVLQTADINKPRLDHDPVTGECKGLLMEGARTNLVNYSEQLNIVADWDYNNWRGRVDNNVIIAPDGTLTGAKYVPINYGYMGLSGNLGLNNLTAGTVFTISGYYKHDGSYLSRLRLGGVFGQENAIFDFITGEFVSTESNVIRTSAVDVGNGWWRLAVTYEFINTIGNGYPYVCAGSPRRSDNDYALLDTAEYNGVYIWGMQFEQAPFPSSYIPTDGATVTRGIEIASVTTDKFEYNEGESSFYVSGESGYSDGIYISAYLLRIRGTNDLFLYRHDGGTNYRLGGNGVSMYHADDHEGRYSAVFGYKGDNSLHFASSHNDQSHSDTSYTAPSNVLALDIGWSGGQPYYGHVQGLKYYNRRLADSELQALTQE